MTITPTSTYRLSPLPADVLSEIFSLVPTATLASATLVNTFFSTTATPHLYATLRAPLAIPARPTFLTTHGRATRNTRRLSDPAAAVRTLTIAPHPADAHHARLALPRLRTLRLELRGSGTRRAPTAPARATTWAVSPSNGGIMLPAGVGLGIQQLHGAAHPHMPGMGVRGGCALLADLAPRVLVVRGAQLLFASLVRGGWGGLRAKGSKPAPFVPRTLGRALEVLVLGVPVESAVVGSNMRYEESSAGARGVLEFAEVAGAREAMVVFERNEFGDDDDDDDGDTNEAASTTPPLALFIVFDVPNGEQWRPSPRPHALGPGVGGTWLGRLIDGLSGGGRPSEKWPREVKATLVNVEAVVEGLSHGEYGDVQRDEVLVYAGERGVGIVGMQEWLGEYGAAYGGCDGWE